MESNLTDQWVHLRGELKTKIKQSGELQGNVAKAIGVSPATLSQFLNGTYPSPHKMFDKVRAFLQTEEAREIAPQKPDFVPTSLSTSVIEMIQYCHVQNVIGVVYGDAGVGKTEGIQEYTRHHPEAIVITMSPAFSSPRGVTEKLAKALRVQDGRAVSRQYPEIIEKLTGSGRVIIVDEAQHLPLRSLEHLRGIADESKIGLVLIGNEEVYSRMVGRGEAAFAQLFSRISMRRNVLTTDTKEEDIRLLFPSLAKEEQAFLLGIAKSKYGIRGAVNVYVNSIANGSLNYQGLYDMAKYMGIGA